MRKLPICHCAGVCLQLSGQICKEFIASEPKADPKEKELLLEWNSRAFASDGGSEVIGANFPFGFYAVTFHFQTKQYTWSMNDFKQYPCTDFDDGKRQAQDHFNSKLKLCLNREL